MIGFELKGKQRMLSYTQIIEKGISGFFTGLFYSYVSITQPSIHPVIHGTAVICFETSDLEFVSDFVLRISNLMCKKTIRK